MDKKVDKMMWNLHRIIQESEWRGLHPNGVVVGYDLLGKLLSMYNAIIIAKGEERLLGLPIAIDNEDEDSLKLTFKEFSV